MSETHLYTHVIKALYVYILLPPDANANAHQRWRIQNRKPHDSEITVPSASVSNQQSGRSIIRATHLPNAHLTQPLQPLQQVLVAGLQKMGCNLWPHIVHVACVDVGHHAVKHIPADVGDLYTGGVLRLTTRSRGVLLNQD